MPRKLPKKWTTRDDRQAIRKKKASNRESVAALAEISEKAYSTYVNSSNPKMPAIASERRGLRRALKKRGLALERWKSSTKTDSSVILAPSRHDPLVKNRMNEKETFMASFTWGSSDDYNGA